MFKENRLQLDQDRTRLLDWFKSHQREVPWRLNRDPYRIWISEVMLQQTTTAAVIPFFQKFMTRFPDLQSLASGSLEEVLSYWAGLGYYSRARNLKRAAEQLNEQGYFPKTASELLKLPGFGPYTARAVSSQAFDESVGVLDGNVIRVLTRYFLWRGKWWSSKAKNDMQDFVDRWVKDVSSNQMNQALMELGSTICTPQSPKCGLCPFTSNCKALQTHQQKSVPLKKPKRQREIWVWSVEYSRQSNKVAITQCPNIPFLKTHWVLPGTARQVTKAPKKFAFRHSITHHDIFVVVKKVQGLPSGHFKWVPMQNISKHSPLSLVRKVIEHAQ